MILPFVAFTFTLPPHGYVYHIRCPTPRWILVILPFCGYVTLRLDAFTFTTFHVFTFTVAFTTLQFTVAVCVAAFYVYVYILRLRWLVPTFCCVLPLLQLVDSVGLVVVDYHWLRLDFTVYPFCVHYRSLRSCGCHFAALPRSFATTLRYRVVTLLRYYVRAFTLHLPAVARTTTVRYVTLPLPTHYTDYMVAVLLPRYIYIGYHHYVYVGYVTLPLHHIALPPRYVRLRFPVYIYTHALGCLLRALHHVTPPGSPDSHGYITVLPLPYPTCRSAVAGWLRLVTCYTVTYVLVGCGLRLHLCFTFCCRTHVYIGYVARLDLVVATQLRSLQLRILRLHLPHVRYVGCYGFIHTVATLPHTFYLCVAVHVAFYITHVALHFTFAVTHGCGYVYGYHTHTRLQITILRILHALRYTFTLPFTTTGCCPPRLIWLRLHFTLRLPVAVPHFTVTFVHVWLVTPFTCVAVTLFWSGLRILRWIYITLPFCVGLHTLRITFYLHCVWLRLRCPFAPHFVHCLLPGYAVCVYGCHRTVTLPRIFAVALRLVLRLRRCCCVYVRCRCTFYHVLPRWVALRFATLPRLPFAVPGADLHVTLVGFYRFTLPDFTTTFILLPHTHRVCIYVDFTYVAFYIYGCRLVTLPFASCHLRLPLRFTVAFCRLVPRWLHGWIGCTPHRCFTWLVAGYLRLRSADSHRTTFWLVTFTTTHLCRCGYLVPHRGCSCHVGWLRCLCRLPVAVGWLLCVTFYGFLHVPICGSTAPYVTRYGYHLCRLPRCVGFVGFYLPPAVTFVGCWLRSTRLLRCHLLPRWISFPVYVAFYVTFPLPTTPHVVLIVVVIYDRCSPSFYYRYRADYVIVVESLSLPIYRYHAVIVPLSLRSIVAVADLPHVAFLYVAPLPFVAVAFILRFIVFWLSIVHRCYPFYDLPSFYGCVPTVTFTLRLSFCTLSFMPRFIVPHAVDYRYRTLPFVAFVAFCRYLPDFIVHVTTTFAVGCQLPHCRSHVIVRLPFTHLPRCTLPLIVIVIVPLPSLPRCPLPRTLHTVGYRFTPPHTLPPGCQLPFTLRSPPHVCLRSLLLRLRC